MARNNRPNCPKCGERLWWSQSLKAWRCPNPFCGLSPQSQRDELVEMADEVMEI